MEKYTCAKRCLAMLLLCSCLACCKSPRRFVKQAVEAQAHQQGFHRSPHKILNLETGRTALAERVRLIRAAKQQIDVQYFLFYDDDCGDVLGLELVKAALRGVQVRVLVDQMFMGINLDDCAAIMHNLDNFSIKVYNPVSSAIEPSSLDVISALLLDFNRINQRMHNKLLCVDGTMAICGGRNIGNAYFDYEYGLNFRDRDILIEGAVVADLQASFNAYWDHHISVDLRTFKGFKQRLARKPALPSLAEFGVPPQLEDIERILSAASYTKQRSAGMQSVGAVAAWVDPPGKYSAADRPLHMGHQLAALQMSAEQEIILQSPYLVLSDRAIHIFKQLRKKAVHVFVSTNSLAATDNWPTYAYLHRQKKLMLSELGLQISEFKPFPASIQSLMPSFDSLRTAMHRTKQTKAGPLDRKTDPYLCLHAKGFTVDDRYSVIGTYNLDPRSQDYNTELMIVIDDSTYTQNLKRVLRIDLHPDNAWIVARRQRRLPATVFNTIFSFANDVIRNVSSLDIWPIRHCSCYSLKQGCEPVSIFDPRFYEHYTHVGIFPGLSPVEAKGFLSKLSKAFGGFLRPVL